ncbi:MAG: HU family DNA-binding protein [Patescibacteria group bacterium]|jgi:DNA-binding protein HU-beta|nr:HU family DNA-binding protein [Patescibacteria group bacterium]
MNKSEVVDAIATKTGLSKKDSEATIEALIDTITGALQKGDQVAFTGFGTFKVTKRAARKGINPATREPLDIPASNSPKFKAGKSLKEAVN